MKSPFASLIILTMIAAVSCKHKEPVKKDIFTPDLSTLKENTSETGQTVAKEETHYGILTPIENCVIFNHFEVPYNSAALNATENSKQYLSSSKAAINTGIYGVDFGYLKMFGVGQEVINYMMTIREMSNRLGIPDKMITEPIRRVQNDLADPDSLTTLMQKAYLDIEDHLRQNNRESTAGLIVMGGWVEAMYIATQLVYNPANPDTAVIQKIAEQKYTLNSLLSFMKNYYNDPVAVYYTKKLKYLLKYFDSFDIYFMKGDLEIDTVKQVFRSSGAKMTITVETLNKIRDYIASLRTEMITV